MEGRRERWSKEEKNSAMGEGRKEEEDGVMAMEWRRRVEREMDVDGEELDGHGRGEAWWKKVEKMRESE